MIRYTFALLDDESEAVALDVTWSASRNPVDALEHIGHHCFKEAENKFRVLNGNGNRTSEYYRLLYADPVAE